MKKRKQRKTPWKRGDVFGWMSGGRVERRVVDYIASGYTSSGHKGGHPKGSLVHSFGDGRTLSHPPNKCLRWTPALAQRYLVELHLDRLMEELDQIVARRDQILIEIAELGAEVKKP